MEIPLLRQWITQMVHDSLKLGNITLYFHESVTGTDQKLNNKGVVSLLDLYKAF